MVSTSKSKNSGSKAKKIRTKQKILLSWSGGKDSALALFELKCPDYEVAGLLTTVEKPTNRVRMHDTRMELIEAQAKSLELPLYKLEVSAQASNEEYEAKLTDLLLQLKETGISGVAFGDLHLEDIRAYREKILSPLGMKAIFPLWKWKADEVTKAVFGLGYKAVVTCVDTKRVPPTFVGRNYDSQFVDELPSKVDPCGENGEFHTFVFNGLFFQHPIPLQKGEVYSKDHFTYQDLKLS